MAKEWKPEPELLEGLMRAVPGILEAQKESGQFGTDPWVCGDQNVIYPLAAAWSLKESTYYQDEKVLDAIVKGGDALIEEQDENGMWTFRKKDHSTWGQILMPWTYSRWIRAYRMVREAMTAEAKKRWDRALLLGFEGISKTCLGHVHNIPAHHAMGLYCASEVFERDDWKAQAMEFMGKVAGVQSPNGWWPEHKGPVVAYNFVYSDSLGVYYGMSGDASVLEALERASKYHASFTYPDGSAVETVDGRNPYHAGVHLGNPGFSHTASGRGYLAQQHALHLASGKSFDADYASSMLLYGGEGPLEETAAGQSEHVYQMGDEAVTIRKKPWFLCLSAFMVELPDNRWGQDRQNFVSVFHDKTGLIAGGGNTKLQPLWSTFTVGDTSLLSHTPGDEEPDFSPREGLLHAPDSASYEVGDEGATVTLNYGEEVCAVRLSPKSDTELEIVYKATANSGEAVEGHVTLLPHLDQLLRFASGESVELGEENLERSGEAWIEHGGWRLVLPEGNRVVWPVLPHNPYRKAGDSTIEEARLVVAVPFQEGVATQSLTLQIL